MVDSDDSVSGDREPESGETTSEVEMPEAEAAAPITSGRAPSYRSARSSDCDDKQTGFFSLKKTKN